MPKVKALVFFEHHGRRNEGDVFEVSEKHAGELVAKDLVSLDVSVVDAEQKATGPGPATRRRSVKAVKPETPDGAPSDQAQSGDQKMPAESATESAQLADAPAADAPVPNEQANAAAPAVQPEA